MSKLPARIDVELIKFITEGWSIKKYKNTEVFDLVRRITNHIYPEVLDFGDKLWELYMPLTEEKRKILIPFFIRTVKNLRAYFIFPDDFGSCEIRKGRDKSEELEILKKALEDVLSFLPLLKKNPKLLEKVPYFYRKGKIKARYVMKETLPKRKADIVLKGYKKNLKRKTRSISLNDYLDVAAICYRAVFKEAREKRMSPEEMYKRWADGRDCGMLKIKNKNSKRGFSYWLKHKACCGGHPFEIIFSFFHHGILLYPREEHRKRYMLSLGNYGLRTAYFEIVKALLKEKIAFEAPELEDVILHLTGEKEIDVNTHDIFKSVIVSDEDKKLIKLVRWEKLKQPKWKRVFKRRRIKR